jgi:hypothetical protein
MRRMCHGAIAFAGIADRDVWCNPVANQPAQKAPSPISGIGRKPVWL